VVVGEEMTIAQVLGGLGVIAEDERVRADFGLGKDDTDLDDATPLEESGR